MNITKLQTTSVANWALHNNSNPKAFLVSKVLSDFIHPNMGITRDEINEGIELYLKNVDLFNNLHSVKGY